MDDSVFVDNANHPDAVLVEAALDVARQTLGLQGKILAAKKRGAQRGAGIRVRLGVDRWHRDYLVEARNNLRPQILGLLLDRLADRKDEVLLVADHVTPQMAETLREQGISFLDTAGNAYIRHPPVLVWVKGERPAAKLKEHRAGGRAFTPSGLQVILALLARRPAVNSTYRHIGILAGVAHGTVGWVMPELEAMGFVGQVGKKRKLLNVEQLLERWAEAYLRVLRPKVFRGRFASAAKGWWKTAKLEHRASFGGEVAAAKLTGYLEPGTITLYVVSLEPRLQAELGLRKDDAGNVEIFRRFWSVSPGSTLAPLPVVYADLLATGDARNLEAARLVRERFLAGPE